MDGVKAMLFDAGGTLVLQDPVEMSTRLGMTIDPGAAFEAHYRAMAEFSQAKLEGSAASWDWWLERYFDLLGHPEPATAGPMIDRGYGLWRWAIPQVAETVVALRDAGVRVAVVSNSDGSVQGSLAEAGLSDLFEFVVDSAMVGVAKPDPAIFALACERLGLEPAEVGYVGDSVYHDIEGAGGAGLAVAWLVDPLGLHPEVPRRVRSIAELG